MFLTQYNGVVSFFVVAIGCNQSGSPGLCYDVCVLVIWASLMGVEMFLQHKLTHNLVLSTLVYSPLLERSVSGSHHGALLGVWL